MAGLKPSVNLFALLDSNDPGDKLAIDLDDGNAKQDAPAGKHKKTATPAANLTKDLFAQAYPTARDYVIRKNQLERQARFKAKVEAEANAKANNGVSGDDKSQQPDMSVRFEVPKRQQRSMSRYHYQAAPAEVVEAPPAPQPAAPPSPPSLYDINEFPSLK